MRSWISIVFYQPHVIDSFWYQNLCEKCGKNYVDAYYFDGDWEDLDLLIHTWESGR